MQCDHACRGLVVAHTEWAERCNPINHRTPRRNAFQALLLHLHRGDVENEWLCVSDKAIGEDLIRKLQDLVFSWLAHHGRSREGDRGQVHDNHILSCQHRLLLARQVGPHQWRVACHGWELVPQDPRVLILVMDTGILLLKELQGGVVLELGLEVFQNRIPLPVPAFWVVILSLREVPRRLNTHCTRWAGRGPIPTTTVHL